MSILMLERKQLIFICSPADILFCLHLSILFFFYRAFVHMARVRAGDGFFGGFRVGVGCGESGNFEMMNKI